MFALTVLSFRIFRWVLIRWRYEMMERAAKFRARLSKFRERGGKCQLPCFRVSASESSVGQDFFPGGRDHIGDPGVSFVDFVPRKPADGVLAGYTPTRNRNLARDTNSPIRSGRHETSHPAPPVPAHRGSTDSDSYPQRWQHRLSQSEVQQEYAH